MKSKEACSQRYNQKKLAQTQIIATCVLMGASYSRCADVFSMDQIKLQGRVIKLIKVAGLDDDLHELLKNKFGAIKAISAVKPIDFLGESQNENK